MNDQLSIQEHLQCLHFHNHAIIQKLMDAPLGMTGPREPQLYAKMVNLKALLDAASDLWQPAVPAPPDTNQCQSEKPNGHTFMTLGGRLELTRCKNKPVFIVRETAVPAKDGLCGAMSMCAECFVVFSKQVGMNGKILETILDE